MTADSTWTGPTRLAEHLQWPSVKNKEKPNSNCYTRTRARVNGIQFIRLLNQSTRNHKIIISQ